MPHITIEHSDNLDPGHDLDALVERIRLAAIGTGVFPEAGVRVRLVPCRHFAVADAHPANGFAAVLLRVGEGRDVDTRARASRAIHDVVCDFFAEELAGGHFMVSTDLQVNEAAVSHKTNPVHARLATRNSP